MTSEFKPGALVRTRSRDWVVTGRDADLVRIRPIDGSVDGETAVFVPFEANDVRPAEYDPPDPGRPGNFDGALLLRDALRLSLRSGAGPFRSFGHLQVRPRPYQIVPLLMGLRLDPVRMLIADDVGVGKTIEAAMVARELLDRGLVRRIGVLCAPHLCVQWEQELREKFGIDAVIVQPARMGRLERDLPRGDLNVFGYYRHLVASIDFVKSDRYRRSFVDNAPELLIVDEAHTAARPRGGAGRAQHQRYELLRDLAASPTRHLILATATPHSGIEESFRSLLGLLDPAFDAPEDRELPIRRLAAHFVQRRRPDLEKWLGEETPFPERESIERTYNMSPEYLRLFEDVLQYCRESVAVEGSVRRQQQRVRYWAAIAILRCVLSSPAAAQAVLENRRRGDDASPAEPDTDSDAFFGELILDSSEDDQPPDYAPAAPLDGPDAALTAPEQRRLDAFLKAARALAGPRLDAKLAEAARAVDELLRDGFRPIVYCRFIATAEYVARELQSALASRHPDVHVVSVTGGDGDSEVREAKVENLVTSPRRVLVATDCLSEGINLQEHFDAVVHYDLPWNPNRLEQREGRVDRYGQARETIKTVLLYGSDNPVDLVVLDVLIRKAKTIRRQLGISVPVPVESDQVVQAVVDSILLRGQGRAQQLQLALDDPKVSEFHQAWDAAAEREQRSRTRFAQHQINPDQVSRELEELEPVLGSPDDVRRFLAEALQRFGGELREAPKGVFEVRPGDLLTNIVERAPSFTAPLRCVFDGVPPEGVTLLSRNHPVVATVADAVLSRALAGDDPRFPRCSAIYTDAVRERTAIMLLRLRYLLAEQARQQFAEEVVLAAFARRGSSLHWLTPYQDEARRLLGEAQPTANMEKAERSRQVAWALGMLTDGWYAPIVEDRVKALTDAHDRLRRVVSDVALKVEPHVPPDIVGCYVLVPARGGR
jgi:superfamily II DNA or RNA helicase